MEDLKKWPIFTLLSPEFVSTIRMAYVYDVYTALIVTNTDTVYQIQSNKQSAFSPLIVESLCGLDIKTFASFQGPHVLILTYGGMVYSLGKQFFNKNKFIIEGSVPVIINSHFNSEIITDIACGQNHFLVLTSSGKVYESLNAVSSASAITDINKRIVCISCGHSSNVIVTDDGEVYSWHSNNVEKSTSKITELCGVTIKKVACGYMHVLALTNNGDVYVWGANSCGQLGIGSKSDIHTPTKLMTDIGKIVDIATNCYNNISIAVGTSNRIFMWGQCLGQDVIIPIVTSVSSIHDAFAYYSSTKVMHQPLVFNKNNENSVLDSLKCAFNDSTSSDLIIQVHGNPINVHKSILMMRCQYFRTRFQEDCENKDQSVIEENMFSHDVFKAFLKYLYTDKIDAPPEDTDYAVFLVEFLKLADHYSQNRLKKSIVQFICQHITKKNAIFWYSTAITYNLKILEKSCFKVILRNMTAVVQSPSFAELDGSMIKKLIINFAEARAFPT